MRPMQLAENKITAMMHLVFNPCVSNELSKSSVHVPAHTFVIVACNFRFSKEAQNGFLIHFQSIVFWIKANTLVVVSCLSNGIIQLKNISCELVVIFSLVRSHHPHILMKTQF